MNADIRPMRTPAELALLDAFGALKHTLPGSDPVAAAREAAFHRFEAQGLPHRRVEEWKYTDLRTLMREAKPLAAPADAAALKSVKHAGKVARGVDARRVVLVNGVFVPELSDLSDLEPGLAVKSLAAALADGDVLVAERLAKTVATDDIAVALNTALMGDGAVIHVGPGVKIERPIHLLSAFTGEAAAVFTRSLAVVEAGASLTLIETHEGPDGIDYQVNNAVELAVGDDARVDHIKIATDGGQALHVGSLLVSVGANAQFEDFTFATGSAVTRNQIFVRLDGEGTQANLRGATLLNGRQHVDTTLVVDHAAGGCQSRELYKTVLDDASRGVFQGKIIVRPHAQKTDGKMMAQALLLSENAEADSKPELEIFADDVVCGHGATAGALDEDLLFYLKARGIPPKEAEALLIQAFIGEAVEPLAHDGLRNALMEAATRWLATRAA